MNWQLLLGLLGRFLTVAPEMVTLMEEDSSLTAEDLIPTPRPTLEARIREREGLKEPTE